MSADFRPTPTAKNGLTPFRYWVQRVLPVVYDDSLSYQELLAKVVDYLNHTIEDVNAVITDVDNLNEAYGKLEDFVNDYFDNLDIQEQIDNKLDEMALDGSLTALISPFIPDLVTSWLDENVDPVGSAVVVDSSLTISGAAADAKTVGDIMELLPHVKWRTTPQEISVDDISDNIIFYANTSLVTGLPENSNGFFINYITPASQYYQLQMFFNFHNGFLWWRTKGNNWSDWNKLNDVDEHSELIKVLWRTTPQEISVDDISDNIIFYANTSLVTGLPENSNGFFINYITPASQYYQLQFFITIHNTMWWRTKGESWNNWATLDAVNNHTELFKVLWRTTPQEISANDITQNICFYANRSMVSDLPTNANGFFINFITPASQYYQHQMFFAFTEKRMYWRTKGNNWLDWNSISDDSYFIDTATSFKYISNIVSQKLSYQVIAIDSMHQDFAVYNNHLFALLNRNESQTIRVYNLSDNSYVDYNGVGYGHGNGIVFGKTVDSQSDYPLIYISGWNDNKVYCFRYTGTTFVLVNTYTLPVSGYTTACVDDINQLMYIFSLDVYPTVVKPYTFIVWDYANNKVLFTTLTEPFETMQGIDLTDGQITVMSGYNTSTSQKLMRVYNLEGVKIGEYVNHPFTGTTEPEGFSIDPITKNAYMSSTNNLYRITRI